MTIVLWFAFFPLPTPLSTREFLKLLLIPIKTVSKSMLACHSFLLCHKNLCLNQQYFGYGRRSGPGFNTKELWGCFVSWPSAF